MTLSYHLETENKNQKNYLAITCTTTPHRPLTRETLLSLALLPNEKRGLEFLFQEHIRHAPPSSSRFLLSADRGFEALKRLGGTGRLFYQDKKVIVDPFTCFHLFFEGKKEEDTALLTGYWKVGNQVGPLHECEWIFPGEPSWILEKGIIRASHEEIAPKWIRLAALGPKRLQGAALLSFLSDSEKEIPIQWESEPPISLIEPLPFLVLTDRHGGFANLWFDYKIHGKIGAEDLSTFVWRNREAEKGWEKDLLETDFIKKQIDRSHYYCPLNKVAKSLTFLLEIGWTVIDWQGRRVMRHKKIDFNADFQEEVITIRARIHYDTHEANLKDLVGAFNRKEQFVELSSGAVALIDREEFHRTWGDLADQEITAEGIRLKKSRFGLLLPLFEEEKIPASEELKEKIARLAKKVPSTPLEPTERFHGTLFSYQKEGLQWLKFLEEGGFGGLLADEMGLGKTVQVLAFFSQFSWKRPCLIVVPTSLLFNWQREIEKFLPGLAIYRHEGKERLRSSAEIQQHPLILTSYSLLRLDAALFQPINYQLVVVDEAQTIKNPDSQIATICFTLKSEMRLAITGTPIENRTEDLWSLFHFLIPDLLGERDSFQNEMIAAQADRYYFERVKKKIRPFLLRRKKEQVALQLPPKLEQTVFVEMTEPQRELYERWLQNTKQGLLKKISLENAASHRMQILEAILRLRQLCVHPWLVEERKEEDPFYHSAKLERLIADVQEVVEEGSKVLIYSQFTKMLQLMKSLFVQRGYKHVYLDGSTKDRETVVSQFQNDPQISVFLISLKAGGVGLNLTAADYVFLYDPWWNEAIERQAIDRAHRLGKQKTVIARRYITALSIEEKILKLKAHKMGLSQHLLEAENISEQISLDDLLALF